MNDEFNRLFYRYLAGETSKEENKKILTFIKSANENKILFRQIKDNYLISGTLNKNQFQKDESWNRLQQNSVILFKNFQFSDFIFIFNLLIFSFYYLLKMVSDGV